MNLLAIASRDRAKAEAMAAEFGIPRAYGSDVQVRDRTGRHIEGALSYRNHPQWQTLADLRTAGNIGDVKSVHATMAKRFPDPRPSRDGRSRTPGTPPATQCSPQPAPGPGTL